MSDPESELPLSTLDAQLRLRSSRAVLGGLSPRPEALRRHLQRSFERNEPPEARLLADPVFEATFGWSTDERAMADLCPDLLSEELVEALDSPSPGFAEQRFPLDRRPFKHQVECWKTLLDKTPRSVLVTSGTGSGKTECFLIPILEDLLRAERQRDPMVGVRAIFIYPLNALIASQRDRLAAWTYPFGTSMRFCLYNGETPATAPAHRRRERPNEVLDRQSLRTSPPPILVTNSTMLEYILVRRDDRPILEASQGRLRWIVLDEAHSYLGSQAAELALLLRRVLHAFGVSPDQVRFVATSATLGSAQEGAIERLRDFLADLSGVDPTRIRVLEGKREIPRLAEDASGVDAPLPSIESLEKMSPADCFQSLANHHAARKARAAILQTPRLLPAVHELLGEGWTSEATLRLLDQFARARRNNDRFLPLRAHFFHRTLKGLWACSDSECPGRAETALEAEDWSFGRVYFEPRQHCASCNGLVFPIGLCRTCGEVLLSVTEGGGPGEAQLTARSLDPPSWSLEEELELAEEIEDSEILDAGVEPDASVSYSGLPRLLAPREAEGLTTQLRFDPASGSLVPAPGPGRIIHLVLPDRAGTLACPTCGSKDGKGKGFRPARLGAPFFLGVSVPTLLEHTPVSKSAEPRPYGGRRLITFTDSRQGTANLSLRAQLEAERFHARSILYHQTLASRPRGNAEEIQALRKEIELLRSIPALANVLAERKERLARIEGDSLGRLSWKEAAEALRRDQAIRSWIPERWRDRSFGQIDSEQLSDFILLRELMRRPTRDNSLETLGLVALRYPAIERLVEVNLPALWRRHSLDLESWKSFLYMVLDHFVRSRSAIVVPKGFLRWLGASVRTRFIVGPENDANPQTHAPWPGTRGGRSRSRIVQALSRGLRLEMESGQDRAVIDQLLADAWSVIRRLLSHYSDGYQLDLSEQCELVEIQDAYLCPVTRTVLPRSFLDRTPYLQPGMCDSDCRVSHLEMPRLPWPFWETERGARIPREEILQWLEADAKVRAVREAGAWSDLNDRIAAGAPYFRVEEHSAQQSSQLLRQFESSFKEGWVNVLSCSTTMEMGVDIGGLSAVAMNNAPPSPSNFLQRAGRAGRRGEGVSVSLTLCQSQPHGEAVFRQPLWPFVTPLYVPRVSLESERIVRRHVHSLALARFLDRSELDPPRLVTGWFFEPPGADASSPSETFESWCRARSTREDENLNQGLHFLTRGTRLAGVDPSRLLEGAAQEVEQIQRRWLGEIQVLEAELEQFGGKNKGKETPAQLAVTRQLKRARGEYLLGELASLGFLPAYGFPTHVVPFVPTTLRQLRHEEARREMSGGEREDARARARDYPSRELWMAIRDYAPGNEFVVNGRILRSEGVLLNWHLPPGDREIRELQAFRIAWFCKRCGASSTSPRVIESCTSCDSGVLLQRPYLKPAGFAVSLGYEPHNDLSAIRFLPVEEPWITTGIETWSSLPQANWGRYRWSSEGHIFHFSRGLHSHGFAICLRCGRAASEVMESSAELPGEMSDHFRLRGGKELNGSSRCSGNDEEWAIKRNQWLGVSTHTDVFELQLLRPDTGSPPDRTAAYSIAVALREALAEHLGIETREIGVGAIRSKTPSQQAGFSSVLFDRANGGAGFVAELAGELPRLINQARARLDCPRQCDRACQACLLGYDTQHHADYLDRKAALEWLNQRIVDSLELPEKARIFGTGSRPVFSPLADAIRHEMRKLGSKNLNIYLGEPATEWDPESWIFRPDLHRLAAEQRAVKAFLPRSILASLDPALANGLASLAEVGLVSLFQVAEIPKNVIAEVDASPRIVRFGSPDAGTSVPGPGWGAGLIVKGIVDQPEEKGEVPGAVAISPATLRRPPSGTLAEIAVRHELEGPLDSFGAGFWKLVSSRVKALTPLLDGDRKLSQVRYTDRYLRSPLSARLLFEIVKKLVATPVDPPKLTIQTSLGGRPAWTGSFSSDWKDPGTAKGVLQMLYAKLGSEAEVRVVDQHTLPHARELELRWEGGTSWKARLDHGLGAWTVTPDSVFDHQATRESQTRAILKMQGTIRSIQRGYPTYVYVCDVEA
jgi:DEAD/DEAH box helicase domain-containing protein